MQAIHIWSHPGRNQAETVRFLIHCVEPLPENGLFNIQIES